MILKRLLRFATFCFELLIQPQLGSIDCTVNAQLFIILKDDNRLHNVSFQNKMKTFFHVWRKDRYVAKGKQENKFVIMPIKDNKVEQTRQIAS